MQKSKAVWCAPDRGKAWIDYMVRDMAVPVDTSCPSPIDKVVEYGKSKRIQGTPTIFFEDGERVPGAMAIADFEKKLASAKAAPSRAAAQ
jgi:thiol:disulfide interchange protein DsbC